MLSFNTLNLKTTKFNKYLNQPAKDLLDRTFVIPAQFEFDTFEVTKEYIARPDLIAYEYYGDDMYTDLVCKFNDISNPFELNEGKILLLPSPEYMSEFHNKVSAIELSADSDETDVNVPKPKARNEKRKANEAVVGDKRYEIDANKHIIIY